MYFWGNFNFLASGINFFIEEREESDEDIGAVDDVEDDVEEDFADEEEDKEEDKEDAPEELDLTLDMLDLLLEDEAE